MFPKDYVIDIFPDVPERFAIFDKNGKLIDDANGYGYTSKAKAKLSADFKASGKLDKKKNAKKWWKEHQEFSDKLDEILFYSMKDGEELSNKEYIQYAFRIAKELKINDFNLSYLWWR